MSTASVAVGTRVDAPDRAAVTAVSGRFLAGDPLRGLACMGVVVFHLFAFTGARPDAVAAFGAAFEPLVALDMSVWVFFVLSGYLLGKPFVAAIADGRSLPNLRRYARNRILRIVPAFWVVLTLIIVFNGTGTTSVLDLAAVYAFLQTWVDAGASRDLRQGWTVHSELVYYLLLPLAAILLAAVCRRMASRAARMRVVLWTIAVIALLSMAFRSAAPPELEWLRLFPAVAFSFMPGVLLAAIEVKAGGGPPQLRYGRAIAFALLAVAAVLFLVYMYMPVGSPARRPVVGVAVSGLLVAAPMVWQWTTAGSWRLLDNPVTRYLGERSYSIYLVHFAVGVHLGGILARGTAVEGFLLALPVLLGVSILLGELGYRFVERPFLQRKLPWRRPTERPA